MAEFKVAEEGHVVPMLPPIDMVGTSTRTSLYVNMANYSHCDIILGVGVQAGAATAIVYASTTAAGAAVDAIACNYYAEETTVTDVLGARTALATTGMTIVATSNIFYVISVESTDLTAGYPFLNLRLSALDSGNVTCAYAILSGARHASPESATVQS